MNNPNIDIDSIISQLLSARNHPGKQIQHPEAHIIVLIDLCRLSRRIFLEQPMLVELGAPVNIVGDILGHFDDLLRHFDSCGYPPTANYIFLGNYVDRGCQSLEVICLLLAYKIKYPQNFFTLRGNHESESMNMRYGFYDDCERRYNIQLWRTFTNCFNYLPICGLVSSTILCMHGGLSPDLTDLNHIRNIYRPCPVLEEGLFCDLLWSDLDKDISGWRESDRGVSYKFGLDVVRWFLGKLNLLMIARAHQVVEAGYELVQENKLVTIFSATNYSGQCVNDAAVMAVSEDLTCTLKILKPASLITYVFKANPCK